MALRIIITTVAFSFLASVLIHPQIIFASGNNDGALGRYSKPVNESYGKARKSATSSSDSKKTKKKRNKKSNSSAGSFGDKINKAYRKTTNQEK